jgi:hypothetical protein
MLGGSTLTEASHFTLYFQVYASVDTIARPPLAVTNLICSDTFYENDSEALEVANGILFLYLTHLIQHVLTDVADCWHITMLMEVLCTSARCRLMESAFQYDSCGRVVLN